MKTIREREFTTYPRKFAGYRWFKPLLTGLLFILFAYLLALLVNLLTGLIFHTTVSSTGYDDLNFYTAAGAFFNGAAGAVYLPALLIAALIVKERPISSYFSSMGGWRWKTFLKTFAVGFVIFGIPVIVKFLLSGKTGDAEFTLGGFIFSELHILNNVIELIMGGLGFGKLVAEQKLSSILIILALKLLFLAFIIFADKKLHWFDEVRYDDIEPFNAKHARKRNAT